ncbi:MAG TPA: hypothetical protein VIK53_17870 [Verrucomicrobiae bacterium]
MHAQTTKLNTHPGEIATLLRGEAEPISAWSAVWNARRFVLHVAVIVLGAGVYGAAMGRWRDPQQGLYIALKSELTSSQGKTIRISDKRLLLIQSKRLVTTS